ncbi:MAG TPA: FAD:protein FMN transferase [Thermoanaerobaculia bacterium]|nr:FAD:protein FMN transferase [Thermoanaerobaculia bacterium]
MNLLALPLLLGLVAAEPALERRVMLMGTSLDLAIEAADRASALAASERAVAALEAAEARLSTWRDDSELARWNRGIDTVSPALAADLAAARSCREETDGAFDPAVGALVQAWDLRGKGRIPKTPELRQAVAAVRSGRPLEEGGFGKGAGLADALEALAAAPGVTRASLDLGGQLAVFDRQGGGRWEVPVADPRNRERAVVSFAIDRGSVSTSGNSERGIVVDGRRLGHILDPRTGEPAPDFGSITVWTDDPLRADCLSTGLYVMGPERALAWAAAHPGVEVLVLRERDGKLDALATPGLEKNLKVLVPDVRVEKKPESGGLRREPVRPTALANPRGAPTPRKP